MIEYYRKEVPMQNQAFMKVDISSILGQINENITFFQPLFEAIINECSKL